MDEQNSVPFSGADREVLFRTVIDTAVDGIIVIDERGGMMLFNRAAEKLFGYTPADVLGRNVSMLMPEPYQSQHDAYMGRYLATGEARIIGIGREVRAQRKDRSTFPMYLSVGEGSLAGKRIFLGIIHDLTDRKLREEEVQSLQNELLHALRLTAMGQLTSALAHELNQPLTAIMNYMNAARRGLESAEDPASARTRELLEKAVTQTARAGQIIRRLRDFVEKREPNRSLGDLNESVAESIALGLVGAADRNIGLKIELEENLPAMEFDRVQIQQVMINLMRNAVEAMEGSPRQEVTIVTAMPSADFVEVAVCDTGPGIAPDIHDRLFQPFATTKARGLGMGLSICQAIVDAHGGRMWVAPNPGGGTQFRFRLPAHDGAEV
jgi:two-component system sensor kinase FixL